ncbi:hypothetical protein [Psychrobacter pacificensis]|uniref:hypothetical protein n=1 Tax=Psychrobacter pacificensis TaxID=112002 RepID=UPI0028C3BB3A|nr:hypothetical protein [Psychrobacter pacificensis]
MASAIRTLLKKKKLTGEELGRLLLIDLADTQAGKPNLSQEEIANLHNYIDNPTDGKVFNDYIDIQRYIIAFQMDYQIESRKLAVIYLQFHNYWTKIKDAENAYYALATQPRVLTRRDYEKLLSEARARVESYSYSFTHLMLHEAETYTPKYKEGQVTPYDNIFKKLKEQPIPAHMVEKYQTIYKRDSDLEEYNKFDYLHGWIYVYDPAETDDPNSPLEFVKDYPDFVQAVIDKYSKLKGLERLAKMEEADYIRDDLIDFRTAYDLDILGAKKSYDTPILTLDNGEGSDLANGIAVIEDTGTVFNQNIKDGTYYYKIGLGISSSLSENVLKDEELINRIAQNHYQLKQSLKRINGFAYGLNKFIEITGVQDLSVFDFSKGKIALDRVVSLFEDIEFYIYRYGLLEDERPVTELREEVKALLMPDFTEEDVAIQPHEQERVEEIIANASSKGEAVRLVGNYLTGLEP